MASSALFSPMSQQSESETTFLGRSKNPTSRSENGFSFWTDLVGEDVIIYIAYQWAPATLVGVLRDHIKYRKLFCDDDAEYLLHKDDAARTLRCPECVFDIDVGSSQDYDGTNAVAVFGPHGAHIWGKQVRMKPGRDGCFEVCFSFRARIHDRVKRVSCQLGRHHSIEEAEKVVEEKMKDWLHNRVRHIPKSRKRKRKKKSSKPTRRSTRDSVQQKAGSSSPHRKTPSLSHSTSLISRPVGCRLLRSSGCSLDFGASPLPNAITAPAPAHDGRRRQSKNGRKEQVEMVSKTRRSKEKEKVRLKKMQMVRRTKRKEELREKRQVERQQTQKLKTNLANMYREYTKIRLDSDHRALLEVCSYLSMTLNLD